MESRIKRLREKIKNFDGFLIAKPENIYYLSGFTAGEDANLIVTKTKVYILTDFRYIEQVKIQCPEWELAERVKSMKETIAQTVKAAHIEKLAFEQDKTTFDEYTQLKEVIGRTELVPVDNIVEELRIIKDKDEIDNIRHAAAIADKGFEHILKFIKPGVKESDLALELEFFMRKNGASGLSFETIVASGKRSALPHGTASEKVVEKGDFVTFDFGCVYNHYCSDMTRTVVVGEASEKQKEIYSIVLEANKAVIEVLKPGANTAEIDKVARDIIAKYGYAKNFGHGLGHGVGLLIHESPTLSPRAGSESILEPGMIVTDEPGIYIADFGGVRIEDFICITENGIEVLSHSPKELIVV